MNSLYKIVIATFLVIPCFKSFAMELPDELSKKRPGQEVLEQDQSKKAKVQAEQNAVTIDYIPDELKMHIVSYLLDAPGATETMKLHNAAQAIRTALMNIKAFSPLLNDINFNAGIIRQLAQLYTGGSEIEAALALATNGASKGLYTNALSKEDASEKKRYVLETISHFEEAIIKRKIGVSNFILRYATPQALKVLVTRKTLNLAVIHNNPIMVEKLIARGAPINQLNPIYNDTALMLAVQNRFIGIVKQLIAAGARINAQDSKGYSALMIAAQGGYDEIVKELINAHAIIDLVDVGGYTALALAALKAKACVVKQLLAAGANVNSETTEKKLTPLMLASLSGSLDTVKLLLQAYAHVNVKCSEGCAALINAVSKGNPLVVRELLAAGANINDRTFKGNTALMMAANRNHFPVVEELLAFRVVKAEINALNNSGLSALVAAVFNGNVAIVKALIGAGAGLVMHYKDASTILSIAQKYTKENKEEIIKLLRENGAK